MGLAAEAAKPVQRFRAALHEKPASQWCRDEADSHERVQPLMVLVGSNLVFQQSHGIADGLGHESGEDFTPRIGSSTPA